MKMTFTTLSFLFLFFIANISQAQQDPVAEINKYFTEAASNRGHYLSKEVLENIGAKQLLKITEPHLVSENSRIRYAAIDLISGKGRMLHPGKERYPFVIILIEAVSDPDGGNNGAALRELRQFTSADFNNEAKEKIMARLKVNTMRKDELLKIAGFAGCHDGMDYIKTVFTENLKEQKKVQWAANLALARMGDTACMNYCLRMVKSEPVNDNVVWYLFPDLLYTRQPEGINYMLGEILSDDKKCSSPNPNSNARIICAYYIMELVAPVINNFPLPLDDGDLEIDDYDEALSTVREWIQGNPGLVIDKEMY